MIPTIRQLIESNRRFLVASHGNPDGDAIASTLALGNALTEMGKEVTTYNADPVPVPYAFLPGAADLKHEVTGDRFLFDVGFILDSGKLSRAGEHLAGLCRKLVAVDHHRDSESFGEADLIDPAASSTGTLIYRVLKGFPDYRFTPQVAACIYTAILSDTGSFRFANTDAESFRISAEMLETGVAPAEISHQVYENQDAAGIHLLARALSSLELSGDGRIATLTVTLEDMEQTAAGPAQTDGFVDFPRSIRGVEVAVLFRQTDEELIKVGLRSRRGIDVSRIARELGGGGHLNASGATLEGTLPEIKKIILDRIRKELPPAT